IDWCLVVGCYSLVRIGEPYAYRYVGTCGGLESYDGRDYGGAGRPHLFFCLCIGGWSGGVGRGVDGAHQCRTNRHGRENPHPGAGQHRYRGDRFSTWCLCCCHVGGHVGYHRARFFTPIAAGCIAPCGSGRYGACIGRNYGVFVDGDCAGGQARGAVPGTSLIGCFICMSGSIDEHLAVPLSRQPRPRLLARALPCLVLLGFMLVPVMDQLWGLSYYVGFVSRLLIMMIAASSLNFILGYGGMVALGHASFMGVGAYALVAWVDAGFDSAWIAWGLGVAVAAVLSLLIGLVALRTRGVYFIMITLAFAEMLYYFAVSLST